MTEALAVISPQLRLYNCVYCLNFYLFNTYRSMACAFGRVLLELICTFCISSTHIFLNFFASLLHIAFKNVRRNLEFRAKYINKLKEQHRVEKMAVIVHNTVLRLPCLPLFIPDKVWYTVRVMYLGILHKVKFSARNNTTFTSLLSRSVIFGAATFLCSFPC